MPRLSVIVPNYNHARYLRQRLDSIYNQTFNDFEVILLDDASTDGSVEILQEYATRPNTRFIRNETNSGSVFRQWNKGVKLAHGDYVWIAESDDWSDCGQCEALVGVLDTNPEAGLAFCGTWVEEEGRAPVLWTETLDAGTQEQFSSDFVCPGEEIWRRFHFMANVIWNASAALFRRELYLRMGGAVESFVISADYQMWARMMLTGSIGYVAAPMNHWRRFPGALSHGDHTVPTISEEAYRVLAELGPLAPLPSDALDRRCNTLMNRWLFRPDGRIDWRLVLRNKTLMAAGRAADPWFSQRLRNKISQSFGQRSRLWHGGALLVSRIGSWMAKGRPAIV